MAYKYQFTKNARKDLDDIVGYIAVELANPTAATNFVDKLQDCICETCLFPESGAKVLNEFLPDIDVRKKIIDNYIMYYFPDIKKQIVIVLRIIYGRRNIDEILNSLDI